MLMRNQLHPPIDELTYSVHLHPTVGKLTTKAPPTIGAINGPITTAMPQHRRAGPLCVAGHMSAKTPPVLLSGAPPNTPEKKREMSSVWMSLDEADAKENRVSPKTGIRMDGFRP
jgi:hypothetical protein